MTGLPPLGFITHERSLNHFEFTQTEDKDAVGQYIVTVESSIEVPTDSSPISAIDKETVRLEIEIRVNPCQVSDFIATPV